MNPHVEAAREPKMQKSLLITAEWGALGGERAHFLKIKKEIEKKHTFSKKGTLPNNRNEGEQKQMHILKKKNERAVGKWGGGGHHQFP